jgi:hypothetical protein
LISGGFKKFFPLKQVGILKDLLTQIMKGYLRKSPWEFRHSKGAGIKTFWDFQREFRWPVNLEYGRK